MKTMTTMTNTLSKTTYRKDYQPPVFFIDDVALHVDLYDHEAIVRSRLRIRHNRQAETSSRELFLNGEALTLVSLSLDGESLTKENYSVDENGLTIKNMPDSGELIIVTKIHPQNNKALSGLYRSGKTFCTQCEAE